LYRSEEYVAMCNISIRDIRNNINIEYLNVDLLIKIGRIEL